MMKAPPIRRLPPAPAAKTPRPVLPRSPRSDPRIVRALLQRQLHKPSGKTGNRECEAHASKAAVLQRELAVGRTDEPLEREADRVADQVLARSATSGVSAPTIQRAAFPSAGAGREAPESVQRALSGSGRPLDPATRDDMGQRFARDFSTVRVHDGGVAAQSARDVDARAYTVGDNIVFGAGQFAPGTSDGRRLIAHELTHVLQQRDASGGALQRKVGGADSASRADAASISANDVENRLGDWRIAFARMLTRLNWWSAKNLTDFAADWLNSDKGNAEIEKIEGGITDKALESAAKEMGGWAVSKIGKTVAAAALSARFLATRAASVLGGVAMFVVAELISAAVDWLTNKTAQLVKYVVTFTSDLMLATSQLILKRNEEVVESSEKLGATIRSTALTASQLTEMDESLRISTEQLDSAIAHPEDRSLYLRLALANEVYASGRSPLAALFGQPEVDATRKPLETLAGQGEKVAFNILRDEANEGPGRKAPFELNTVQLAIDSWHCLTELGFNRRLDLKKDKAELDAMDPALLITILPTSFRVTLTRLDPGKDPYLPERWFNVGFKEFATWYNVPKGEYRLVIHRYAGHGHPIRLCGLGEFKAGKAA